MSPNYPTEDQLDRIRSWPTDENTDWNELLRFVQSIWEYAEWGYKEVSPGNWEVSTGGWSGNEDIIGAMQENVIFWMMCWQSSRRGGHYVFKVPDGS